MCDSIARVDYHRRTSRRSPEPSANKYLIGIIGVDRANRLAEDNPLFVPQSRACEEEGNNVRIVHQNRYARRDKDGVRLGVQFQWLINAGVHVDACGHICLEIREAPFMNATIEDFQLKLGRAQLNSFALVDGPAAFLPG